MRFKKLKSAVLAFSLIALSAASVFAVPEESPQPTAAPDNTQITDADGNTIFLENPDLSPPDTACYAALLLDDNSGRLLYGKNIDVLLYPASLTKIMTAVLALENGNLSDTVTVPYDAIASINYLEDSNMGLLTDEQMTLEQMLSAMMVHSANDAANVIAFHISGSLEAFVDLMNKKAAELGMTNTNFANACGSHDDNHYTTARDMSTLARYAMKNEKFREIVKTPIYKIPQTNKYTLGERVMVNTNLLLGTSRSLYQYYPAATGIKTGHTSQAGYCLTASASYNGANLITVVMKCDGFDSHNDPKTYQDTRGLFEFAFSNYENHQLAAPGDIISDSKVKEAKDDSRVALTVENNISALVPVGIDKEQEIVKSLNVPEELRAPIAKGDVVGSVSYTYRGTEIGNAKLVATNDVELNYILHIFNLILKVLTSPFFFVPVLLLIFITMYMKHLKKKKERKRRIQQLKRAKQNQNRQANHLSPDRRSEQIRNQREVTRDSNTRYKK